MKNIFLFLLLLVSGVWITSCKQDAATQQSPENTMTPSTSEAEETHSESVVQLNQGQKWQANAETTQGITAMQNSISGMSSSPVAADFTKLKESLQGDFNLIFEKCTMTGEAHNQLHNFLGPLKHLLETIDSGTPEENAKAVEQVKLHLETYATYFQ